MSEENVAAEAVEEIAAPVEETQEEVQIEPIIEENVEVEETLSSEEESELEAMVDESLEDGDSIEDIKEMIETFKFLVSG